MAVWKQKCVGVIMLGCVVLHSMIVDDERERNLSFILTWPRMQGHHLLYLLKLMLVVVYDSFMCYAEKLLSVLLI